MVSEQEGLERYLKVLNEQLDRKKGTEDFKQLQELFESKEFWRCFGHSGWTLFWRLRGRRKRITGQW